MRSCPNVVMPRGSRRIGGFVLLDAMAALGLTVTLLIALTVIMGRQRRASADLSDSRFAHEQAEAALLTLQSPGAARDDTKKVDTVPNVTFERTNDKAAAGYAWVRAKAVVGRATAEVYGMVPVDAVLTAPAGGEK